MPALEWTHPWLLSALLVLPVLWWFLRLLPPAPKRIIFPALRFVRDVMRHVATPAHTPWWLLLLRLTTVAALIIGLADPHPVATVAVHGTGDLLLIIDNDWAAARDWAERQRVAEQLIDDADRAHRNVTLVTTTAVTAANPQAMILGAHKTPVLAHAMVEQLMPQAWPADWDGADQLVTEMDRSAYADTVWLASGLGNTHAHVFYEHLQTGGGVRVIGTAAPIYTLAMITDQEQEALALYRADTAGDAAVIVDAVGRDGNRLAHLPAQFKDGAPRVLVDLQMIASLRNQIARFEVAGQTTAATTYLIDSGFDHPPVGLVGEASDRDRHSLLSGIYYLDRALSPFVDLRVDHLEALLASPQTLILWPDDVELTDEQLAALQKWVEHGGTLLRFAGERLVATPTRTATLLPVLLHVGDRSLGGTMDLEHKQGIQPFADNSPFAGLSVPTDVTVNRQALAEPDVTLGQKTWAALQDGTPLVTAKPVGRGQVILFHVPPQVGWSNLPLSGLFVDMLRRMVDVARTSGENQSVLAKDFSGKALKPIMIMDAFGRAGDPPTTALPLSVNDLAQAMPSPQHPPGFYGIAALRHAFNLGAAVGQPEAWHDGVMEIVHAETKLQSHWQGWLLGLFCFLFLIDFVISLSLRGLLAIAFLVLMIPSVYASDKAPDLADGAMMTDRTYLAFVRTGNATTDDIAMKGLRGLARQLQARTTVDHTDVVGVDPNHDRLAFYPLLYWPLMAGATPLTSTGVAQVNNYIAHGGMIVFDTMDGENFAPQSVRGALAGLHLPPLARIPDDHVLKRSFYLLDTLPGRYDTRDFWLEPEEAATNDGVATILLGSNNWAAAWATDASGNPLFPCMPDGEVQREHAYRFGINLVMYALTGNYKADQLHATALLQKMGGKP